MRDGEGDDGGTWAQAPSGDLYDDAIVIDGLNCSNWDDDRVFNALHRGGLTAVNASSVIWDGTLQTLDRMAAWLRRADARAETILLVRGIADIQRAKQDGRVGIIVGWQNGSPIENDLGRLQAFHALGVRIIQLTYNYRNLLGSGCMEVADDGLSRFGREAVREMNRLGILIDLSHVGDRTTLDTIERSECAVAITHANARAHIPSPRNKTDETIRLLAERGGVIGANAFPRFLARGFDSTLDDFLDAVEQLIERAGIDHVGIGTDFTQAQPRAFFDVLHSPYGTFPPNPYDLPGPECHPRGLESPEQFRSVASGMLARGYRPDQVAKIIGGNWLRLFGEVWQ